MSDEFKFKMHGKKLGMDNTELQKAFKSGTVEAAVIITEDESGGFMLRPYLPNDGKFDRNALPHCVALDLIEVAKTVAKPIAEDSEEAKAMRELLGMKENATIDLPETSHATH